MSLIVFAFHFNRPASLENLVASIERHVDAPLVIMDDDSTDPAAHALLEVLSARHEVIRPEGARETESWTGGLHANMDRAMAIAAARGAEIALMVQDDMQIVRDVTADDLASIRLGWSHARASFVTHACFLKANRGERVDDGAMRRILPATYERHIIDPQRQAGKFVAYADTGFFNVALFQKQLGQFRTAEIDNERALRAQKLRMPFMAHPIMHWCPMPVSFRSRTRRWQDRLADTMAGAGVHPIAPLQGEALVRLMTRDDAVLPYADDFLQVPSMPSVRYWSLRGGKSNLQARGGWRRALARWL